jgi:D-alanyl-D-alanine dipeptidase
MWWLIGCHPSPPLDLEPAQGLATVEEAITGALSSPPEGFVDVQEAIPGLWFDARYATNDNPMGQPLPGYGAAGAWLREDVAEALKQVVANLETEQLGLMLFDAYRPDRAERAQTAWLKRTGHQHLLDAGHVRAETTHPLGTAVDVTLIHLPSGEPFDMGTPWGALGEASRYESAKWPHMENRTLLRAHMNQNGFRGVKSSWWHFHLPIERAVRRDVPYGCFEVPEGAWVDPEGWTQPTYREPPPTSPGPCLVPERSTEGQTK